VRDGFLQNSSCGCSGAASLQFGSLVETVRRA
jgi:hypothetical protein